MVEPLDVDALVSKLAIPPDPSGNGATPAPADLATETASLLEELHDYVTAYVRFAHVAQPVAVALWTAHTWAFAAADCTPYLLVVAPEHESGKTLLGEVLERVARHVILTADASGPALFRAIDQDRPTLMYDEVDGLYGGRQESDHARDLAGILNSGYKRSGAALRCVGEGSRQTPTLFSTYCPKLLAGRDLGRLPRPLVSRSIPVRLQRKARGDELARFRPRLVAKTTGELTARLERWAKAAIPILAAATPALPEELSSRQQDIWEPLLSISDLASAGWSELARAAAVDLHQERRDESYGVLLLEDLRDVYRDYGFSPDDDKRGLSSEYLLSKLIQIEDRPWAGWWADRKGQYDATPPVKAGSSWELSRKLSPYDIKPKQYKQRGFKNRGYLEADFVQAWDRYCAPLVPGETT
jgi:Protein of unknown function (DUF3631)